MEVIVQDANNIVIEVDQGRQGRGVEDVSLITVGADYYLLFTFTDGTTEQVGPIATTVTEVISAEVRNAEAVTILKGQPVYLYQAQGNLATVKLAYNTSDATSAKTLGLAAENIAPNAQGLITCQGTLGGLNTAAYNEGDTLYLGATAGTLTNVKPQAPNHLVYIGVVERANAGAGQIYVRVQNGFELDEIHDVRIVSPVNGNTLIYDASTSLWKNAGITAGSGVSVTNGPASITVGNTGVLSLSGGTTGLTPATATTGAVTLAGTLGIANGGTGQTTANAALNALLPAQTSQSGKYLKTDGTNASWDQLDISTADITGVLPTANGGTGLSSFTANRVLYTSSTSAIGQSANLTFDGTTLTANALTITNNPTLSAGTANGVLYLNGSKVATSGSALTFDGTNLSSSVVTASSWMYVTPTVATNNALYRANNTGGTVFMGLDNSVGGLSGAAYALTLFHTGNYPIVFSTNSAEQMRLTSTGLGIGTSSPTAKLTVQGDQNITDGTSTIRLVNSGGQALFGTSTNHPLVFRINNTQQMILDTSGNLGLGVTPSAWSTGVALQTRGAGLWDNGVNNTYLVQNAFFNGTNWIYRNSFAASQYLQIGGAHQWWTAPAGTAGNTAVFTQAMTLDASGNLGVGLTNPSARVHASAADATAYQLGVSGTTRGIRVETNATESRIVGVDQTLVSSFQPISIGGLQVVIRTNGTTEAARFNSSGNLALGNVTPSAWYTSPFIDIGQYGAIGNNSGGGGGFALYANAFEDTSGTFKYKQNYSAALYRTFAGAHQWFNAPSGTAGNTISFTQAMTLSASGYLGVGITNPANRIDAREDVNYPLSWGSTSAISGILSYASGLAIIGGVTSTALGLLAGGSEKARITAAGNQISTQPVESAQNTSVTLTVANLQARIITSNAAVTLTLPTGTTLDTYATNMAADMAFECTFIATTANAITIAANGNTTVGSLTVAGDTSGTFRFRKTATNTFTVYRVA